MQLPYLGLGLSTNFGPRDVPDPQLLHEAYPELFDFIEYSAPLAVTEAKESSPRFLRAWERRAELPLLFHPTHLNLYGPELESPASLLELRDHLEAVGSPWVGNDVAWWHTAGVPFPGFLYLAPPLDEQGLASCISHARHVQSGLDRPLLLENPTLVARRGQLHVLDFMARLSEATGCGLILDLGHLLAYQLSAGLPPEAGFEDFPWGKVLEIHLAGGAVTAHSGRQFYFDDHTLPLREETFALLGIALPRCVNLRALTFEGDGHPEAEARVTLERLRDLLPQQKRGPIDWPLAATPGIAPDPQPAIDLFARAYGEPAEGDPVGERVETDFRLAVLAERIDRDWPLSRVLLCPDRAGLALFSGSPEFGAIYLHRSGLSPSQAFGRYVRRRARESRDEALQTVVAFETICQDPSEAGRVATFPLDLGEVLFAYQALRRHLGARARATELFEVSAYDGLRQAVTRARPGPWRVQLRPGHLPQPLLPPDW